MLPDKTAVEKLDALRAYGAEIVLTSSALPREHPDHVIAYATRLAKETDGGWLADQYGNPANPDVHRRTTGPEIWEATGGRITHLVSTIGTGGTITGTGQYLHEVSDGRVQVVGADPVTSAYGGGDGSPFAVEAAGHYIHPETATDVFPDVYRRDVIDRFLTIGDRESVLTARALAPDRGAAGRRLVRDGGGRGAAGGARGGTGRRRRRDPPRLRARLPLEVPLRHVGAPAGFPRRRPRRDAGVAGVPGGERARGDVGGRGSDGAGVVGAAGAAGGARGAGRPVRAGCG